MALFLDRYTQKYGALILEDITKPRIRLVFVAYLLIMFEGAVFSFTFLFVDFSHHPTLSSLPPLFLQAAGVLFVIMGVYLTYTFRSFFTAHGYCLFEKGLLAPGSWGFDEDDDFALSQIAIARSEQQSPDR